MRFTHTTPFYSVLSTLGLFAVSPAYSSIVRSDVDYQYFRDFAENKGAFSVGASNISIQDKQGKILGRVLSGIPMPDFRVSNRQTAIASLPWFTPNTSTASNTTSATVPYNSATTPKTLKNKPIPTASYHATRTQTTTTTFPDSTNWLQKSHPPHSAAYPYLKTASQRPMPTSMPTASPTLYGSAQARNKSAKQTARAHKPPRHTNT